jgi:hypothetical protein
MAISHSLNVANDFRYKLKLCDKLRKTQLFKKFHVFVTGPDVHQTNLFHITPHFISFFCQYYSPIYIYYLVVSSFMIFRLILCTHFRTLPVLHSLTIIILSVIIILRPIRGTKLTNNKFESTAYITNMCYASIHVNFLKFFTDINSDRFRWHNWG